MYEFDKNIIKLIDILAVEKKINSKTELYDELKILRQTITKIRKGINHFTPMHIEILCKKYNVNANWIFGIEKNVFITPKSQ